MADAKGRSPAKTGPRRTQPLASVVEQYVHVHGLDVDEAELLRIVADDCCGPGGYADELGVATWKMSEIRRRLLQKCGTPNTEALRTRMYRDALEHKDDAPVAKFAG